MSGSNGKVVALSGGVGGAKLALGLAEVVPPERLLIVANTGDDFEHLGLNICPDLDSVMYALAGINDETRGWGLRDETWEAMGALERIGGETWFRLGDRDLATHLQRSILLREGKSLSATTLALTTALGIKHTLQPMSDDRVRTVVATDGGELAFQHYFVREQCAPAVRGFRFDGIDAARPNPMLMQWLREPDLAAVIICPSNPFVSVDPILGLAGVREALISSAAPVIAISPIIGGAAVKGPAAKMLGELDMEISAAAVARHYDGLLDGYVLDETDSALAGQLADGRCEISVTRTLMYDLNSKRELARSVLDFAREIA